MFTAGLCWAGGFLLSAAGVYIHNIWLVYLGYGVLGGSVSASATSRRYPP